MFTLRFVSLFLLSATLASAGPTVSPAGATAVEKGASTASVETVFNTLKGSTGTILPKITALGSSGTASDTSVTPLISELTAAINTASASLAALPTTETQKRQSEDDIAILAAGLVTDIANTFNGFPVPGLDVLLVEVDVALNELLVGLDVLLVGVSVLVSGLLVGVAGVLEGLGLGLVLGLLGL
ncbi:hypothetical protein DFH07DRAFT_1007767 [Mycena maculata]|uniref:Uncharacterized protein n=1 Tax=Mycena maculata TaxID=230809 RepID=A0AAD7NNJ3_9AGAR|nr:hypothetical protein DFH07DRAFT_1007767 [Mycena maculata]